MFELEVDSEDFVAIIGSFLTSLFMILTVLISTSTPAFAQENRKTIIVTDIDETLRSRNVRSSFGSFLSLGSNVSFYGMNSTYDMFQREHGADIFYVSNSSREGNQKNFVKEFQVGTALKGDVFTSNTESKVPDYHKLSSIEKIINDTKPSLVLFVGDNAGSDPRVYDTLRNKFAGKGITFLTYIRIIYNTLNHDESDLRKDQTGFYTAAELALDLYGKAILSSDSTKKIISSVADHIKKCASSSDPICSSKVLFPAYSDCREFRWIWKTPVDPDLVLIYQSLQKKCGVQIGG
jgi:hypothetical protein